MIRQFVFAAVFGALAMGALVNGGEVRLAEIVPEYMPDDLETAIIPTPKQADLKDTAVLLEETPVCVAPPVLVQAATLLAEKDLLARQKTLLAQTFATEKKSRQAWGAFRNEWKSTSSEAASPGWPSPLGTAMEIADLFPGITFQSEMPRDGKQPVLLFLVQGMNMDTLKDTGNTVADLPEVADPVAAAERYVLQVTNKGAALMIARGVTPWGALWGVQTLRQMIFAKGDKRYARLGTVRDYPTLIFRGGKRTKDWWVRYKGNGRFERWAYEFPMRKIPRSHSGVPSAKPKHVTKHKEALRQAVEEGASHFLLDFNDGRFKTSESEEEPFPGDPAKTVKFLLDELYQEREALKSNIKIGYMGVAYAINRSASREGALLRAVNALAKVDFVMMNGLEVFSGHFPAKGAEAYREALGAKAKLMMYDCQCLRRRLRTPDYRDKDVYKHLLGISAQGASPIFFIGLADYTWNPEQYDHERALKLAIRELADGDPETYKRLYEHIAYLNENNYTPRFMERKEMLAQFKSHTDNMVKRLETVKPLLEKSSAAKLTGFGVSGKIDERVEHWPMIEKHGFKNYRVGRAQNITVDGKLDEEAWKKAPTMTTFFPPKFKGLSTDPLPEGGRSIVARALYDDEKLYVGYQVEGADEPTMKYLADILASGETAPGGKVAPAFEMFIKTDLSRDLRWQLMHRVPKLANSWVLHYFDPANPMAGNDWQHQATVLGAVTGKDGYTVEISIDYWKEIKAPTKGDVWGVQLQMNRVLGGRKTPYWLYQWSYAWDNSGLWSWEYPYGRWRFE